MATHRIGKAGISDSGLPQVPLPRFATRCQGPEVACFSEIQRILRGEIPVDLTGRDLIYSRQGSQESPRRDYERHSWSIATGFVASVNLKAGNHLEGSAVVVRIIWFWRDAKVGQASPEVPDISCLTDTPGAGVIGSRPDQRPRFIPTSERRLNGADEAAKLRIVRGAVSGGVVEQPASGSAGEGLLASFRPPHPCPSPACAAAIYFSSRPQRTSGSPRRHSRPRREFLEERYELFRKVS